MLGHYSAWGKHRKLWLLWINGSGGSIVLRLILKKNWKAQSGAQNNKVSKTNHGWTTLRVSAAPPTPGRYRTTASRGWLRSGAVKFSWSVASEVSLRRRNCGERAFEWQACPGREALSEQVEACRNQLIRWGDGVKIEVLHREWLGF